MDVLVFAILIAIMFFGLAVCIRGRGSFTRIVVQKQPPVDINMRMAIDAKSRRTDLTGSTYTAPTQTSDDSLTRAMALGLALEMFNDDDTRRSSQQSMPDDNFQAGGGSFGGGGASGSWDDNSSKSDTSSNNSSSSYDSGSSSSYDSGSSSSSSDS